MKIMKLNTVENLFVILQQIKIIQCCDFSFSNYKIKLKL